MSKEKFDYKDFEKDALEKLKNGESLLGKEGILTPLIKQLIEASLEGELDYHLKEDPRPNRRNGKSSKRVKTGSGSMELKTPRDRSGTFEPELVKKRQTTLGESLDRSVLKMYTLGNSYADIQDYLLEMYDLEVSAGKLCAITDKILPELEEWRSRPLEAVYPFVWMDAIHFKVREAGRVVSKAVYCIIGVTQSGRKELLTIQMGQNEGAKFWLQVLTDLNNRGVEDILIACIDNLKGFPEAIEAVFPKTEVQLCIIHQIRNSLKFIGSKDQKEFMKDLKKVYRATTRDKAEMELDALDEKWGSKYGVVIRSWRKNWDRLSCYFSYAPPIRKVIYTTNIIEGLHRQFRKITKTKGAFINEKALMKLLYLAQKRISSKWTQPLRNWGETISQLSIIFEGRLRLEL